MQLHHPVPHNWGTQELICESKRLEGKQRWTTMLLLLSVTYLALQYEGEMSENLPGFIAVLEALRNSFWKVPEAAAY